MSKAREWSILTVAGIQFFKGVMMRKTLVAVIALTGLAGCGHPLPKPVDPLHGMEVNSNKPMQRADLRAFQGQKIGMILSENTRNSIVWKTEEIERINGNFAGVSRSSDPETDSMHAQDHSGLAVSVERVLREKFKDVTLVPDIHTAINEGMSAVVVIDIQAEADKTCPSTLSDCYADARSQHSLIFVDTQTRNPLAILQGKASIAYCNLPRVDYAFAYAKCIQDTRIKSLETLRGKLAAELPDTSDGKKSVATTSPSGSALALAYEENKDTIENGAPAEMYSLGLRMEQGANAALAGLVYQAIVRRFPDSPFAAKALERQEGMIAR